MRITILIYSKHPLALQVIANALTSDKELYERTVVLHTSEKPYPDGPDKVLLLDTCSQEQWLEIALEWEHGGGHVILLVPGNQSRGTEQLRSLYMGVRGIVSLSPDLDVELPKAVRTVVNGGMWINRDILDEYVKRTNSSIPRLSPEKAILTTREEQVAYFVCRSYSNKQIASALRISERTVKYHVSNILQKSCVGTRKELLRSITVPSLSTVPVFGCKGSGAWQNGFSSNEGAGT